MWSGFFNFLGVLTLHRRGRLRHRLAAAGRADPAGRQSAAGFAMVFALLIAAIIWNLGTWWLGPAGFELAYADRLDHWRRHRQRAYARAGRHLRCRLGQGDGDRSRAAAFAARRIRLCRRLLLLAAEVRGAQAGSFITEPEGKTPPPLWIRGLLILTCTGVSFRPRLQRRPKGHGSHHADPDRHRAHGLRAESRLAGEPRRGIRLRLAGGVKSRGVQGRRRQRAWRSRVRRVTSYVAQSQL